MAPKRSAGGGSGSSTPPGKVLNLGKLRSPKTSYEEKPPLFQVIGAVYQDKAREGQPTGALLGAARVTFSLNTRFYTKIEANRLDDDLFGRDLVRRTWGKFKLDNGEEGKHVTFRIRSPGQEDKDRLAYAETMNISIDDVEKHEWTSAELAKCTLTTFPMPDDSSGAIGVSGEWLPLKTKLADLYEETTAEHPFRGIIVHQHNVQAFKTIINDWGYILDEFTSTTDI